MSAMGAAIAMTGGEGLGDFHNPDNLTPAQIGTAEGWRLLRVGEVGKLPDSEVCHLWDSDNGGWMPDASGLFPRFTYRTRRPDPLKAEPRPVESSPSMASKPALVPVDSKPSRAALELADATASRKRNTQPSDR